MMCAPETAPMDGFRPALDWNAAVGREVWYGVVTDRDADAAFWHRLTLLSTDEGYGEARVWAALTSRDKESFFETERFDLDSVEGGDDELGFGKSVLSKSSSIGEVNGDSSMVSWEYSFDPDTYVFTPLRSSVLTGLAVRVLGASRHWSYNQSVEVDGAVEFDGGEVVFDGAPGHMGHTAGGGMPPSWTWMHMNSVDGVAVEALEIGSATSVCFRLEGETYPLNRLYHVVWRNESLENGVGRWRFRGRGRGVDVVVDVEAGEWCLARYLAPDGGLRYVAHSGLADVKVSYSAGGGSGEVRGSGRVEWAAREPPVGAEDDYRPSYPV